MDFVDIKHRLDDPDHIKIRKLWSGPTANISRLIEKCRSNDYRKLWGFVEDNHIISSVEFYIRDDGILYVSGIGVTESHQRQGIGRTMIERLRDMHQLPIELETDDDAADFYRKCGMKVESFVVENNGKPYRRWKCTLD